MWIQDFFCWGRNLKYLDKNVYLAQIRSFKEKKTNFYKWKLSIYNSSEMKNWIKKKICNAILFHLGIVKTMKQNFPYIKF